MSAHHRGFWKILAMVVAVLGAGLVWSLPGPGQAPPTPGQHVAFAQGNELSIPYLDPSQIYQEYKCYPDPKPKVVRTEPVNATTVSKAAEELIESELAKKKCKAHSGGCSRVGRTWFCTYQLRYEGIPLAKTSDAMCLIGHDGHALWFRERNVPLNVNATKATVDRKSVVESGTRDFAQQTKAPTANATEPALEVWVDAKRNGQLCWTFVVDNGSLTNPMAARYWVAAVHEARVVAVENLIHNAHAGTVTGTIWATSPYRPTQKLPLSHLDVACKVRGQTRPTGLAGEYSFVPGTGSTRIRATLAGPACVIENYGGGPLLKRARHGQEGEPINLDFDAKGEFEIAQVSAFYWTCVAREFAKDFLLPSHLWQLTTRVNLNATCNAGFSGADVSINFFRSGKGCPNTAYSDVVLHEYGHAIDFAHGGILDAGYSEGFGDALAILVTRQPHVGRDLHGPGTSLRDARTVVTFPPSKPEPHFVGQIYAGFTWELIQRLESRLKHHSGEDGYEVAKRLTLAACAMNPRDIPDAVKLAFLADDDDGDLTNGSPHFGELAAAADSRKIPRPADPVTTPGPTHAYVGRHGTHHLVASVGTGAYYWKSAERLTSLKLEKCDNDFWYYCEKEGNRWAFSRAPNSDGRFAVWLIPAGGEGRKTLFHFACRVTPDAPTVSEK